MTFRVAAAAAALALAASRGSAQNCPCPPEPTPGWHGDLGAGLAITTGNSDTRSYNLNLLLSYDPQTRNLVRIDGLYLKTSAEGEDTAAKSALSVRDEYKLKRVFLLGEARYQRDRFKLLEYLITPGVGAGYRLVDRPSLTLSVDGSIGLVLEKLEQVDGTTDGALRAGQGFSWKISGTSKLTQLFSAIWKMDDFADAFYHFETGITASVSQRLQLKLMAIVDVKNKPANPRLEKSDEAFVAALVFKF